MLLTISNRLLDFSNDNIGDRSDLQSPDLRICAVPSSGVTSYLKLDSRVTSHNFD